MSAFFFLSSSHDKLFPFLMSFSSASPQDITRILRRVRLVLRVTWRAERLQTAAEQAMNEREEMRIWDDEEHSAFVPRPTASRKILGFFEREGRERKRS
jgi:hypothetical protein